MTIQNPLVRLYEQFQEIKPDLDSAFRDDSAARKRIADIDEKLAKDAQEGRLSTLVFGHYNAGKSTLINALLGCEAAKMGDVPLTAEIKRYEWNGHALFDSPGIDAPIEHEALTDSFIQRECNAVIYVIPTGGALEEAVTWQRLCKFVSEKKAVLIVINDKAGLELNGADFVRIRSTVYQNMQMAAESLGLDDPLEHIEVLHVKARTALKARLENKAGLLAMTGLPETEAVLSRFLYASTEMILNSDRERARQLVNDAIAGLAARAGDEASVNIATCRSKVEQECIRMESALLESTRALVSTELNALHARISKINPDGTVDVQRILRDGMELSQSRLMVGVQKQLGIELERADHVIREAVQLLSQQVNQGVVDVSDVQLNTIELLQNEHADESGEGFAKSLIERMKGMPIDKMTERSVNEMLKLGKDWFPKLFKGIGKKTMGKWAGIAGKAAGPLLLIGEASYNLYAAQRDEAQARERHRQFVVGVMNIVNQAFSDALTQYEVMIKSIAKSALNPVLAALDDRVVLLQSQNAERHTLLGRLATWTRELV